MKSYPITFKDFGENAILVEWPNKVEENILMDIIGFKSILKSKLKIDFELIPAYNSLTIISLKKPLQSQSFNKTLLELYENREPTILEDRFLWKIPVCYDSGFGLDQEQVAQDLNTTVPELIKMHFSHEYLVYGIGFLPGFMYLGGLPKSMETKRREVPRLRVEKGAVGLAGKQTGIYPQESPGGWNIIGNCPIPIFNFKSKDPCLVSVGDKIKFDPISKAKHDLLKIEAEVGIYQLEKIPLDA